MQLGRQGETDVGAHPGHDTRTLHGVSGNVTHNDDDDSPTGPSGMSTDHELQPLHVTNGAPPAIATWDDAAHNPSSLYTQTVGSPPSRKQETTTNPNVSQHAYLSLSLSLSVYVLVGKGHTSAQNPQSSSSPHAPSAAGGDGSGGGGGTPSGTMLERKDWTAPEHGTFDEVVYVVYVDNEDAMVV